MAFLAFHVSRGYKSTNYTYCNHKFCTIWSFKRTYKGLYCNKDIHIYSAHCQSFNKRKPEKNCIGQIPLFILGGFSSYIEPPHWLDWIEMNLPPANRRKEHKYLFRIIKEPFPYSIPPTSPATLNHLFHFIFQRILIFFFVFLLGSEAVKNVKPSFRTIF